MRQDVYDHLPFNQLEAHFDEIASAAYSVSFFTDWSGKEVDRVGSRNVPSPRKTFEPGRGTVRRDPRTYTQAPNQGPLGRGLHAADGHARSVV